MPINIIYDLTEMLYERSQKYKIFLAHCVVEGYSFWSVLFFLQLKKTSSHVKETNGFIVHFVMASAAVKAPLE